MHILLVADGRSPITIRWAQGLVEMGLQVSLASTYPCQPIPGTTLAAVLPVGFSGLAGSQIESGRQQTGAARKTRYSRLRPFLQWLRYTIAPVTLPFYARRLRQLVEEIHPDLVHALRIPYEGMLAAYLPRATKLVISTWGNDLTLHARGSWLMRHHTRRALRRADGLTSDTRRDVRLAGEWGLAGSVPRLVVPGNGGVPLAEIEAKLASGLKPSREKLQVINPRGFRPGSVHQDIFFQAVPLVLANLPQVQFYCPGMFNQPQALDWIKQLKIADSITLLPYLDQAKLWAWMLQSQVYVSNSSHDGTPNSLLEAMACGCLPVCGDIESTREWITDGENGLLVDPQDKRALALAILRGLQEDELRLKASQKNLEIIRTRADRRVVGRQIKDFYRQLMDASQEENSNG